MDLFVGTGFSFGWEASLIVFLQSHMDAFATAAASFLSMLGEEYLLVPVMGFLYWCYDKELGKTVGINLVTAFSWNAMLKNCFFRRRPYFDDPRIKCLKVVDPDAPADDIVAQGWSFPSGHSTNSAAVYSTLPFCRRRSFALRIIGIVIPLLVGVSRFCLGVHYPTDVLAGWLLGILTIAVVSFLRAKIRNSLVLYAVLFLSAVPGLFYCTTSDYYTAFGLMTGALCGFYFEEKVVHFRNTRSAVRSVLRLLAGVVLFLGLTSVTKLPFSSELLNSSAGTAHAIRVLRYALSTFVVIGVYPMVFRFTAKIGNPEQ
ncbi:MAG: phosphatase PAP2 family protein [Clostridia bacterium]|nr:phosphatase PAP2 family protein [Clostridia bacterium]MBR0445366.1 phosphatase PAP2 family protein [Clostridia bacterium]